ncbi:HBS1-like protein [Bulinus truncatus]|nr:HBS1-like protein [Bulinus truncatus]
MLVLEYYDEEDEYSHSVEDNYCISPSTAAQFTWTREKNMDFAAYVGQEAVINEEEEETQEDVSQSGCDSFNDSVKSAQLGLSELDQAKLNSCLEEARNILGDSVSETVMTSVIIQNGYNLETSINQLLSQQDAPKPQREPRQRKNRTQDLIKQQQKVEKKSIPSTVQRVDDPVARSDHSVSLTELARQDKKGISPVRSVPQANSVPKAHVLDFTNLSDLIADYPKGSNSSTKDLSFGSLSPYATQSLVSLSNPTVKTKLDNSQTASPSLSELVKQHSEVPVREK